MTPEIVAQMATVFVAIHASKPEGVKGWTVFSLCCTVALFLWI